MDPVETAGVARRRERKSCSSSAAKLQSGREGLLLPAQSVTLGTPNADVPGDQPAAGCEFGLPGSRHCGSLPVCGPSELCSCARCGQSIMNIRLWTPRLLWGQTGLTVLQPQGTAIHCAADSHAQRPKDGVDLGMPVVASLTHGILNRRLGRAYVPDNTCTGGSSE